jgi:hypothetical protein
VAVCAVFVGFTRFPVMFMGDPVLATPPVNPPVTSGAGQLYVVPAGTVPLVPLAGDTLNPVPLHTDEVIVVMEGTGFTVTVTVNGLPTQVPDDGVTEYVAVCTVLVVFVRVPEMFDGDPLLAVPPVSPGVMVGEGQE